MAALADDFRTFVLASCLDRSAHCCIDRWAFVAVAREIAVTFGDAIIRGNAMQHLLYSTHTRPPAKSMFFIAGSSVM